MVIFTMGKNKSSSPIMQIHYNTSNNSHVFFQYSQNRRHPYHVSVLNRNMLSCILLCIEIYFYISYSL